jgi:7-carboxy-7-deazaguanine synthase
MMLKVSEIFYSIQGEGKYCGVPSVFLRLFGCNFTCQGFANPDNKQPPVNKIDLLDLDPSDFAFGCDTRYSWAKEYSNTAKRLDIAQLRALFRQKIPSGTQPHLVVTGGEPILQQRALKELLLDTYDFDLFSSITFETNGSIPLDPWFISQLLTTYGPDKLLFNNSVKLAHSGESYIRRINFGALITQFGVLPQQPLRKTVLVFPEYQVFKFVVRPTEKDFKEVKSIIDDYTSTLHTRYKVINKSKKEVENPLQNKVWVMPLGADKLQLDQNSRIVAELAMEYGYNYSPRLHVDLFGNTVGT